jgi:hypothetical protein
VICEVLCRTHGGREEPPPGVFEVGAAADEDFFLLPYSVSYLGSVKIKS